MSLNIKNQEAYHLARAIPQVTGQSMTSVVIAALRQQRQQLLSQQQKAIQTEELMVIATRRAAHIHRPAAAVAHGAMLFRESLLFKGNDFIYTDSTRQEV